MITVRHLHRYYDRLSDLSEISNLASITQQLTMASRFLGLLINTSAVQTAVLNALNIEPLLD